MITNTQDRGIKDATELQTEMNFFFWLGEDGVAEFVTEEEFQQRQRDWTGPRPTDYSDEGLGG